MQVFLQTKQVRRRIDSLWRPLPVAGFQRHGQLKELRFRPQIDDHDYQTKLRSLIKFLKRGSKVKVTLVFRGREMAHQEFGRQLLERLKGDIALVAQVERAPAQEGRFIFMTIAPK